MPKIFDRQLEDTRIRRINEDRWFLVNQKALLWLVNTQEGRDFFGIEKAFPEIHAIAKNYVMHHELVRVSFSKKYPHKLMQVTTAKFKIGAKYANVIRYRWEAFQDLMADYSVGLYLRTVPRQYVPDHAMFGGVPASVMHLSITRYPDPNPETTTVDGQARSQIAENTFATLVASAGNSADDTSASDHQYLTQAGTTSGKWNDMIRSFFLFDTSAIGVGQTVTAATFKFATSLVGDPFGDGVRLVTTTPASNTAIVASDFPNQAAVAQAGDLLSSTLKSDGTYNTMTLNATGMGNISLTSITKFGIRGIADATNTAPSWSSSALGRCYGAYAETALTTSDPELTVTYGSPAKAVSNGLLMGV